VQLVCFVKRDGQVRLLDEDFPFDPSAVPHGEASVHALKSVVSLSKHEVVSYFYSQPRVEAWKKFATLRMAHPVVFENGESLLENGVRLILDERTGVSIEK
jgi:hypothetical protein